MDLDMIEGALSFAQLLTKFRECYKKIKTNAIKAKKASGTAKIGYLEELFDYIRFAEAIAKRLSTLGMRELMAVAISIDNQVKTLNVTDQRQIDQIEAIYNRLLKAMEEIDRYNLIENRKAGDLIRFDRGIVNKIKLLKSNSVQTASTSKAANENA